MFGREGEVRRSNIKNVGSFSHLLYHEKKRHPFLSNGQEKGKNDQMVIGKGMGGDFDSCIKEGFDSHLEENFDLCL